MHQGKLVEQEKVNDVLLRPRHQYTRALIAAVPSLTPRRIAHISPSQPAGPLLLSVSGVEKTYPARGSQFSLSRRRVSAVAGVSLEIAKGRSMALVGESGSGKSTLARCIVGLERADRGAIVLEGSDIAGLSRAKLRPYRKALQMIFQDPFASLNPRWCVADIIAQGPIVNGTPRKTALGQAA